MIYSNEKLANLELKIAERMTEKRFVHTLGVRDMSAFLAKCFAPDLVDMAIASALLHDISKQLPHEEQMRLLEERNIDLSESDLSSPGVVHSYTAPIIVKRDFNEFADERLISAIRNHTLGDEDMSVLDEIVFLADFIEVNRTYKSCCDLRSKVISQIEASGGNFDLKILHLAVVESIDYTVSNLISNKKCIHEKIILTRNALLRKI